MNKTIEQIFKQLSDPSPPKWGEALNYLQVSLEPVFRSEVTRGKIQILEPDFDPLKMVRYPIKVTGCIHLRHLIYERLDLFKTFIGNNIELTKRQIRFYPYYIDSKLTLMLNNISSNLDVIYKINMAGLMQPEMTTLLDSLNGYEGNLEDKEYLTILRQQGF